HRRLAGRGGAADAQRAPAAPTGETPVLPQRFPVAPPTFAPFLKSRVGRYTRPAGGGCACSPVFSRDAAEGRCGVGRRQCARGWATPRAWMETRCAGRLGGRGWS